jgi:hypothetical protein
MVSHVCIVYGAAMHEHHTVGRGRVDHENDVEGFATML